jgi:polysaccharide biosynthesis protein PslG
VKRLLLLTILAFAILVTPAQGYVLGFNDGWYWNAQPWHSGDLTGAGAAEARVPVRWYGMEPKPRDYQWQKLDPIVNAIRADGVRPLIVPLCAPDWARHPDDTGSCARPKYPSTYARFLAAVAKRYPDAALEAWNEPNLRGYYGDFTPRTYSDLLRKSITAVRRVDPNRTVLSAGLAWGTGPDVDSYNWQRKIGEQTADLSYEVSIHLFPWIPGKTTPDAAVSWSLDWLAYVRSVMPGRSVWVTEMGQPSYVAGENGQANVLSALVQALADNGVIHIMVHKLYDQCNVSPPNPYEDTYGVIRCDGTRKPAYYVLGG